MSTTGEPIHIQPWLDVLPLEILHEVFFYLHEQLLVLAQVCRYLNSLVTSYYFPGRSNPHHLDSLKLRFNDYHTISSSPCISASIVRTNTSINKIHIPPFCVPSTDILSFLSIAFDIQSVTSIIWEFICIRLPRYGVRLIKQHRHLVLFLSRLHSVAKITFQLTNHTGMMMHPPISKVSLAEWTDVFVELLNLCLEKIKVSREGKDKDGENTEDLNAFKVIGGYQGSGYLMQLMQSWPWMESPRIFEFFQGTKYKTFRGPGWEVFRITGNRAYEDGGVDPNPRPIQDEIDTNPVSNAIRKIDLSPGARCLSKSIKKWTISSPLFLYPPFSEWTYLFLSSTPLTSLTLVNSTYAFEWWTGILSWLPTVLPLLEEFIIRNCGMNIPPTSLAKFISRLPRLKECVIDLQLYHMRGEYTTSNLPSKLKTFVAPVEFIYFTRPKGFRVFSGALRGVSSSLTTTTRTSLSTLSIVVSFKERDGFHLDEVLQLYSTISWVILDFQVATPQSLEESKWPPCLKTGTTTGSNEERDIPWYYGSVKEMVVSTEIMTAFTTTGFNRLLLDLIGLFNGLKILRVVGDGKTRRLTSRTIPQDMAPGTPTRAINIDLGEYGWAKPQRLDSLKGACQSLELVGLELGVKGEDDGIRTKNVVVRDFR